MEANKLLKNNIIYLTTIVIGGVLGYLFNFMLARKLTVSGYGEFQAITSFMIISGVFFSAFSYFIIKYSAVFAGNNDHLGQSRFLEFIIEKFKLLTLLFSILFLLFLPLIKNFLHLQNYWGLIFVGLSMVVSFYASFYSNSFQGWSDFLAVGIIGVLSALSKLLSGFIFAGIFRTATASVLSFLVSAIVGWFVARYYFQKKWRIVKEKDNFDWREKYFSGLSFKKSFINILIFSLGLSAVSNLDIIIVKNIASSELTGYYGALSILGKVIFCLNFAVASVLFPDACSDGHQNRPAKTSSVLGSYGIIIFISIPALLIFYFFGNFLVGTMFGNGYLLVASNLWLFGLMALSLSLLTLEAKLSLARHDFRMTVILFAVTVALFVAIHLAGSNLKSIAVSVSISFFLGWAAILALNIFHRINYKRREIIENNI